MFAYFKQNASDYTKWSNCNEAFLAFDTNQVQSLIDKWLSCSMVKECIVPKGSNRTNHRQDQAAISVLAVLEHHYCKEILGSYGVKIHTDINCQKKIDQYEAKHSKLNQFLR